MDLYHYLKREGTPRIPSHSFSAPGRRAWGQFARVRTRETRARTRAFCDMQVYFGEEKRKRGKAFPRSPFIKQLPLISTNVINNGERYAYKVINEKLNESLRQPCHL